MTFLRRAGARGSAMLFLLPLLLGACSLLPQAPPTDEASTPTAPPAFTLQIDASDKIVRDLLQQYLETLFERYTAVLLQTKITRHEDTLQQFFTFWQSYASELRLLQKQGLFERVLHIVNQWYPTIYRRLQVPWHTSGSEQEILYASTFGAGGYFNILALWIRHGCPETPQEMTRIVKNILHALG